MLDALNAAFAQVRDIPRVEFTPAAGRDAHNWLAKKHANGNIHEPAMLAAFLAIGQQRTVKTFFDLGALYGYFSLAAKSIFPGVGITAFEMHPAALQSLAQNLGEDADIIHAVVSNACKHEVTFWVSGFNIYEEPAGGWSKLDEQPGAMKPRGTGNRGRFFAKVDFITLDAFTVFTSGKPDLIKIDVEAYQAKAVAGAVETLRAYRPHVVIELHDPEKTARLGCTNKSTVQPFFDLGYSAYWCPNFRDMDARYEAVAKMTEEHERLSLMVLLP